MLKRISLQNFKCFKDRQDFHLGKFNIFSGYNGRGKSTLLQSILLLSQSLHRHGNLKTLDLKGCFIDLDLFEDLLTKGEKDDKILIEIESTIPGIQTVTFEYKEKTERQGFICNLIVNDVSKFDKAKGLGDVREENSEDILTVYPTDIDQLVSNISYVKADRRDPALYEQKDIMEDINPWGASGEHSLNVIKDSPEITSAISGYVHYIMEGGTISLKGEEKDSSVLRINIGNIDNKFDVKAVNHGFGYSYILPILVAALSSHDGILIVENPEAHLHPSAQSRLMLSLIRIANANNLQLMVETHSEHVLNALRLAVLKPEMSVSLEETSIYFFDKNSKPEKLEIDENGQIHPWPHGFFDQQDIDVTEILKLGILKGA